MREDELPGWLARRLPDELMVAPPQVRLYPDELVIVLHVASPDEAAEPDSGQGLITRRREETRPLRIQLAGELERAFGVPVAWGMRVGALETLFTSRTAPVMTRLGRRERELLDTLVAAGVADTRSSALAYTVRVFAEEHGEWLAEVRQVLTEVERVRGRLKIRPRRGGPPEPQPQGE